MRKDEWGLVLTGGGGKGAYQVGVWKALREVGLEQNITAVSGVSVGALNGIFFGMERLAEAEDIWKNIDAKILLDIESFGKERGDGIFVRDGLLKLLENYISFHEVSECKKEIYAATSYVKSGKIEAEYFMLNHKDPEEIKALLLASSALPVIYDSVKIGDNVYRDGGMKDNLPIRPLYDAGFRKIIVVGLHPQEKVNAFDYLKTEFLPILPSQELGDFFTGTLDFSKKGAFRRMELGYQDAKRMLAWYFSA